MDTPKTALEVFQLLQKAEKESWTPWERHAKIIKTLPSPIPDRTLLEQANPQKIMPRIQATEIAAFLLAHLPTHAARHAEEMETGPATSASTISLGQETEQTERIFPRIERILTLIPDEDDPAPKKNAEKNLRASKDIEGIRSRLRGKKLELESAYLVTLRYGKVSPDGVGQAMKDYLHLHQRLQAERQQRDRPRRRMGPPGDMEEWYPMGDADDLFPSPAREIRQQRSSPGPRPGPRPDRPDEGRRPLTRSNQKGRSPRRPERPEKP